MNWRQTLLVKTIQATGLCCWILVPVSIQAQNSSGTSIGGTQDLTLFEQVEVTSSGNNRPSRPTRESRATTAEPEFILIGTSRIGSDYRAMVKHRSGEVLLVEASPNENTVIRDYADYSIVDISAGAVSVRYPSNNPCIEFSDRGVRCNAAGNIAELVLANGEPLPSKNPAAINNTVEESGGVSVGDDTNVNPANPFEALRNAQNARGVEAQDGSTTSGQFTPRRINPEDVPEGKRVIATPFGDRLVDL